jgi:hypothetical protein
MDNEFKEPWRFWSKVQRRESGCWEWTGAVTNQYGNCWNYVFPRGGARRTQAHRLSYILAKGEIPEGLQIDHLCKNKICVNPAHLEAVTQRENLLRGDTVASRNAAKTHCTHGHEFNEENTNVNAKGYRICRQCNRDTLQRFYARRGTTNPYPRKKKVT